MKKLVEILTFEVEAAFEKAGYDKQYAKVTLSNRPDLFFKTERIYLKLFIKLIIP